MKHAIRSAQIFGMAATALIALSACASQPVVDVSTPLPAQATVILATAPIPTALPSTAMPPTTVPPTVAPPTAIQSTVVPLTSAPATAVSADADAPGPDWIFALESDANGDGISDKVYYRAASVTPDVSFDNPRLAAVATAASEIALVQRSAAGASVLLRVDTHGAQADQPLFNFEGRREPAGYVLALDPAQGPFLNLLPYGAGGVDYGGMIGIQWEASASGFRVVGERP